VIGTPRCAGNAFPSVNINIITLGERL